MLAVTPWLLPEAPMLLAYQSTSVPLLLVCNASCERSAWNSKSGQMHILLISSTSIQFCVLNTSDISVELAWSDRNS